VYTALLPRTVRTTVLFVDGDPDVRSVRHMAAKRAGLHAEVARDGHEALALATVFHPDVIVLASNLRVLSGPEVVRRLRASAATRPIAILFLSEDSAGCWRDRDVACDLHLTKGSSTDEILRLVRVLALVGRGGAATRLESPRCRGEGEAS